MLPPELLDGVGEPPQLGPAGRELERADHAVHFVGMPEGNTALAQAAKANCPVSRVLNAEITLEATLEG